ncbi:MAG: hypothetical protein ACSLE9_06785 [Burkholderiaceae bacterium]
MATSIKNARKPAGPATKGLRVVSKSPLGTLRRAGLAFGPSPTVVPLDSLTAEQVDAIKGEPLYDVTEVDIEPAKD